MPLKKIQKIKVKGTVALFLISTEFFKNPELANFPYGKSIKLKMMIDYDKKCDRNYSKSVERGDTLESTKCLLVQLIVRFF